MNQMEV